MRCKADPQRTAAEVTPRTTRRQVPLAGTHAFASELPLPWNALVQAQDATCHGPEGAKTGPKYVGGPFLAAPEFLFADVVKCSPSHAGPRSCAGVNGRGFRRGRGGT